VGIYYSKMANRNSWVLCNQHKNCERCNRALNCWKTKARKHGANASALKYSLMCLMDDRTERVNYDEETSQLEHITEVSLRGTHKWRKCGVCYEKITFGGSHNTMVFPCGHSICISCYNTEQFRTKAECPYCRQKIGKAYRLWEEEQTEEEENV
jgi:hypothetical protein